MIKADRFRNCPIAPAWVKTEVVETTKAYRHCRETTREIYPDKISAYPGQARSAVDRK